jgi:hypothetical protein
MTATFTSRGDAPGLYCKYSAATPPTCGAAMLVPDMTCEQQDSQLVLPTSETGNPEHHVLECTVKLIQGEDCNEGED